MGLGHPSKLQVGREAVRLLSSLEPGACVCAHESERLNFNCSLIAKYNKVRVQRIEVILS